MYIRRVNGNDLNEFNVATKSWWVYEISGACNVYKHFEENLHTFSAFYMFLFSHMKERTEL